MTKKTLLVDDDPNILQGYKRQLRKRFELDTALSASEGLEAVASCGPYAVIVSDMRMPGMDGVQFLAKIRESARDSVRMMLTGNSDQQTAMDAVNEGHIFRFLTKPCSTETFSKVLEAGLEQYRLITAERELLTKTLCGSVKLLTDVLSLANPKAFSQASSVRHLVRRIAAHVQMENAWQLEVAAMVYQIGCVTLPEATLDKVADGRPLSQKESHAYQNHPKIGHDLVATIPRLEGVAEIIAYQQKHFDGSGVPEDTRREHQIPLAARILKLAIDFNILRSTRSDEEAFALIHDRKSWYDPQLVDALANDLGTTQVVKSVTIQQLSNEMVLDEHVVSKTGDILIAKGQRVTAVMRERLIGYANTVKGVREPIRVRCLLDARPDNECEPSQSTAAPSPMTV